MTVLKGVLRDIIRPVLRPILRGGDDAITRFFTTLVASGSMHYTIPTVTLTGNYKISALVYFDGSDMRVTGNDANFNGRFRIQADGSVNWRVTQADSSGISSPSSSVPVNKLSLVSVERVGTTGTISVNDVDVSTQTVVSGTLEFNRIGVNSTTSFTDGILADIDINDAGTPIRFYPLNEDFGTTAVAVDTISGQNGTAQNISESDLFTLQSNGDYLGVTNFWNEGTPVLEAGWTDNGDGSFSRVANATNTQISLNGFNPVAGETYDFGLNTTAYASGGIFVQTGGSTTANVPQETGTFTETQTVASGSTRFRSTEIGTTLTVDNISLYRRLEAA